ncbi:MAG TPA: insulinase family protein [Steroidobacteraceae bacterium]|nr:insulinase family protein [Steroidobacteraceae bacterium]
MLSHTSLKNKIAGIALLISVALFTPVAFAAPQSNAVAWPQDHSDLQPDPALKFGVLPNGMRYVIMHNSTPEHEVSLRFRFATGSIQESDAQQGIAHLLEHMAFRGSKHVADGDLDKILERIGLKFGADTNAFTSSTQTVYKFDLPNATDDNVDTGLMLMREIASNLNITDAALKTERGVVLSEKRLRDTPELRAELDEITKLMPGMRAPTRWPIGKVDILEKVHAKTIRDYYQAYYHPERATLIVVGDVDTDKLAKKIAEKFSDWKPARHSDPDPDFGKLQPVDHAVHIFVEPSLNTNISMDFGNAYDAVPDTLAREREDFIRYAGLSILNLRFQQAALADDAPFTGAEASYTSNLFKSLRGTTISINTKPEKWQTGLQAVQHIINDVLIHGVRQDEVDRVVAMINTSLKTAVAGSNTRRTPDLANQLLSTLENNEVFVSPQENADIAEQAFKDIKAASVTAAIRTALTGTNTQIFMTSSKPIDGGEAAVAKVYQQAVNDGSKATTSQSLATWPYTHFGEQGKIAKQTREHDIDTTFVQFANGVTLAFKHTGFSAGQVDVTLKVGDGRLSLKKTGNNPNYMLGALITGGLDKMDFATMQQVLAGKTYRIDQPLLNENHIMLHGATTPADLDTQLQVLTAYLTEPALRAGAFEQLRNMWIDNIPLINAQPLYAMAYQTPFLLHSKDARWTWPTLQQVKDASRDDLKAWLDPQLQHGPIQISIVGDVDEQRAIDAVAGTLGALPARPMATTALSPLNDVTFPAATSTPVVLNHTGNKNQAQALIAWPAPDSRDNLQDTADLQMLSAIIQARMIDAMRSKTGASYTANATYNGSWQFKGYGYLAVTSDTQPEQTQVFFDAINETIGSLRKAPVSADEFARAQQPMLATLEKQHQNNDYWSRVLESPAVDPQYLEWIRNEAGYIKAVTPERVHAAALKYLLDDKAWKAVMLPQTKETEKAE